ncbi:hypothetical protein J6590_063204 [Homalodisca vitripennis]|nr:hypothetical protein J6590_063204 [Homalodisca vitripennis]
MLKRPFDKTKQQKLAYFGLRAVKCVAAGLRAGGSSDGHCTDVDMDEANDMIGEGMSGGKTPKRGEGKWQRQENEKRSEENGNGSQ